MERFQPVYQAKEDSVHSCLFVPGGQVPEEQPWFGIYLRSAQFQDPSRRERLSQFFDLATRNLDFHIMAFLSVEEGVGAAGVQAFGARLDAHVFEPKSGGFASLMWLRGTDDVTPVTTLALRTVRAPNSGRAMMTLWSPRKTPVFALDDGDLRSLMLVPGGGKIRVGATDAEDAISLTCASGLTVCAGGKAAAPTRRLFSAASEGQLDIPITGAQVGCLRGKGHFHAGIPDLGPAIRYSLHSRKGADTGVLDAAFVAEPAVLDGQPATLSLCPSAPFAPGRTGIALEPDAAAFASTFRTRLGRTVMLRPDASGGSSFAINKSAGGARYLTPHGPFLMQIDGGGDTGDLLCGLSGLEYLRFQDGDALRFFAGRPAAVDVTPAPESLSFSPAAQAEETTAWAMIGPADRASIEARPYFSEPDASPLFCAVSGASEQLGYLPLSRHALTRHLRSGAPRCFPILPYAAVSTSGTGLLGAPTILQPFEMRYLNPARRDAIAAPGPDKSGPKLSGTGGTVQAITPQGHRARFSDGAWTHIDTVQRKGDDTHVEIGFSPNAGETELPGPLQDAFLTNQQFLVISKATKHLGTFKPLISMGGWRFTLDPGVNDTPGDYRNVMIFKSAKGTLAELAATPRLWTKRAAFNDTEADRDGIYLSRWLVSYIDAARRLYDNGHGVLALEPFCRLVDDPTWNGFLALNVSVDVGALDPELEVLLAGVDRGLFAAHHIGNLTNHVTPLKDGGFDLNSSPFGLIHYDDPALGSTGDIGYVSTPQPLDFRVLTLEAVFQDAALTRFSNTSVLVLNRMFGDAVSGPGGEDEQPRNALMLAGTYRKTAGGHAYTFASPEGARARLRLESHAIDRVQVGRVTMSVVPAKTASGKAHVARFKLWGSLRFLEDPGFDLLSFRSLGFRNLAVDMTLGEDPGEPGRTTRHFAFDTGDMGLEDNALKLYDPDAAQSAEGAVNLIRAGALLTRFPLKLGGFVSGSAAPRPEAQGFRVLTTTAPEGRSPADLRGTDWNAIRFEMTLGSKGTQAENAPLSAELMLAWPTGGNRRVHIAPYFKLSGPGGLSMSFDIQGVVKVGASDVILNKVASGGDGGTPDTFVMIFEDIALSVLALSFPPAGSTNVFVLGGLGGTACEITPTLGWFGGYAVQDPPEPDGGV